MLGLGSDVTTGATRYFNPIPTKVGQILRTIAEVTATIFLGFHPLPKASREVQILLSETVCSCLGLD